MADKKPIHSKRVSAGTRVYYLDAHKDRNNKRYLAISEIPTERSPQQTRRRIFLYEENIEAFAKAFAEITDKLKNDTER